MGKHGIRRSASAAVLVSVAFVLLFFGQAFGAAWDTVVFRDDFDAGFGAMNMPDPNAWIVNEPNNWWRTQGRTFFPSPIYHPNGPFPRVANGTCIIEHHLYNPYDLGDPNTGLKWTFLGGEIHTLMEFDANSEYRFEARVRWPDAPGGLVASFFTYGYDEEHNDSDEIDFEFLSNEVFDLPGQVLTNPWNDSQQKPNQVVMPDSFDLTDWQIFRIYWYPDPCVTWTWIDPNGHEMVLRTETDPARIPDEPMHLYFNFWAPTSDWPMAYDANLVPAQLPGDNQIYLYEIDYAEVRVPELATLSLLALGGSAVGRHRRRRKSA